MLQRFNLPLVANITKSYSDTMIFVLGFAMMRKTIQVNHLFETCLDSGGSKTTWSVTKISLNLPLLLLPQYFPETISF